MSDNRKEAEEKMAKAIFISADCWLCVFDLLPPSQLGLGIALISHRFDFYVDEHFKTRKRTLALIRIRSKIGENGTKEMKIVKFYDLKPLPIPQIPLPRKVIGFQRIIIFYIDQNAIVFLRRFCQLFAACPINLSICTTNDRISEFILRNIWPMIAKNIYAMYLFANVFPHLRKLAPSILNDCPSLRFVLSDFDDLFTEFLADDNFGVGWSIDGQMAFHSTSKQCAKSVQMLAFASASSPANFIVVICFLPSFANSVVPFDLLTNELTREQLAFKKKNSRRLLLIRCPIARDESKWTNWEEEATDWAIYNQWNQIHIGINDENKIGDGLLDATLGASDQPM
ncbi:hypothetical protein niasHT_031347 [Heterodera trifolii]|uniref:Uncharacterized protein n=1 Tax=Heterodera trifolii TaxID=157864 RepID=A0ABD2ITT0_9BILA